MKNSLLVFIFAGVFLSFSSSVGADWELFSSNSGCGYYYDASSLASSSGNNMKKVWILRKAENYDCVKLTIDQFRQVGKADAERFQKYGQTKSLAEFDCAFRKVRFETVTLYGRDGRIIDNAGPDDWVDVVSEMRELFNRICR